MDLHDRSGSALPTIHEHARATDADATFPHAGIEALRDAGLLGLTVAEDHGGLGGGPVELVEVMTEVAGACGSTAMVYLMHLSAVAVLSAAPPPSSPDVLRELAAGEALGTLAFSEKGSRSHFWAPVSQAVTEGEQIRLKAAKIWVTSAREADVWVTSAKAPGTQGPTDNDLYLVRPSAGGVDVADGFDGLGLRGNDSAITHVSGSSFAHLDSTIADLPTIRAFPLRPRCHASRGRGRRRRGRSRREHLGGAQRRRRCGHCRLRGGVGVRALQPLRLHLPGGGHDRPGRRGPLVTTTDAASTSSPRSAIDLTVTLVERVGAIAAGTTTLVEVTGPEQVATVAAWCAATGNEVLAVHPDGVEIHRGRIPDPVAALPADRRPGFHLWVYSNFHCNLACDYCCVSSSPRAERRIVALGDFTEIVGQAAAAGVVELYVTGGEPFLLTDLGQRLRVAASALPTTVLTNGMVWQGARLRALEALPRDGLALQISLDSAGPELHDRHRGGGSHAKATAGIRLALDLGFHVRVAATLGADDLDEEERLTAVFDGLGLADEQRVVRRVAAQGSATGGLTLSRASLLTEVCVIAEGVWWHPVGATDPAMKVADTWRPLTTTIEQVTEELREHRVRGAVLASTFPCA
jgi:pyruvate-formate lyase-activating enzyme